jgi:predicted dehydrogenase
MAKDVYKVALISAGMISNAAHIPAYRNLGKRIELVGIADIRQEAAEETAKRHGISRAYTDPQKMLDELKPDLVSVCTPNAYHKHWAIAALRSGAHVVCEKPLAMTQKDALEMYGEAQKAGRHLVACQSRRFMNDMCSAREIISTGALGRIYFADIASVRRRGIPGWGNFHIKKDNGGGAFCDLGIHMLDSLLWLVGNPRLISVSGSASANIAKKGETILTSLAESGAPAGVFTTRRYDPDEFSVEDLAVGSMRFEGNFSVNFKLAWALNMPNSSGINIAGVNGGLHIPSLNVYTTMGRFQADIVPRIFNESPHKDVPFKGHWQLMEHILNVLDEKEELIIKPAEVINAAAVIEAFYLSAENGREVALKELAV